MLWLDWIWSSVNWEKSLVKWRFPSDIQLAKVYYGCFWTRVCLYSSFLYKLVLSQSL